MRKYSLYSVARIDDWILEIWMVSLYGLDKIQTNKKLINTSHQWVICKMKSWMNWLIFQCFTIQFLLSKVRLILVPKFPKLPKKGCFICMYYAMSYLLEFLVWFYPWIFEKISVYGGYFMCLAELYWKIMIVLLYGNVYSVSSINHCKVRRWISTMREKVK